MLELERLLAEYKARGRDARDAPVFDDARFRRGQYRDGAVLKFRGIVRDVFDPELVVLSDAAPAVEELTGDQFVERVPLKVALVPYVNDWATQRYHTPSRTHVDAPADVTDAGDGATAKGTKRPNDALEDGEHKHVEDKDVEMAQESDGVKKARQPDEANKESDASAESAFSEAVVTIYVYDGQYGDVGVDAFKVNESFEFTGVLDLLVLSGGGSGAVSYDDGFTAQSIAELTISDCLEGIQRKQQSSVVLHCCDAVKLDALHFVQPHSSRAALLQTNATRRELLATQWKSLADGVDLATVRKALIGHLARAIASDELSAEYMLMCLLSRVCSRPDNATVLGNLSVNLSFEKNVPATVMAAHIASVTETLRSVVPMLASVDMSIESLNEAKFLPHKDYENDMLRGGVLQFAHGTTLLVNETVLSAGNLNEQGVKNVGALQSLVEKMLLPYDFQYYSMDFPQDVAVVSISQGKSILPVHVSVPIELGSTASAGSSPESMIECFRLYLAVLRSLEVGLGNEQAEIAEKHYVACRKAKQEVSAEDLHRWLRLARLVALSHGADTVSAESWQQMLDLEDKRIARIDGLTETAQ